MEQNQNTNGYKQPSNMGYDANGNPIYGTSRIIGYDVNGNPIYETPRIIGYDVNGNQFYEIPSIIGYDANGNPIYAPNPLSGYDPQSINRNVNVGTDANPNSYQLGNTPELNNTGAMPYMQQIPQQNRPDQSFAQFSNPGQGYDYNNQLPLNYNQMPQKHSFKAWKLVSGILSIVFFIWVMFQSCAVNVANVLNENTKDTSAGGGILLSLLMLTGGIVSVATQSSGKKSNVAIYIIYFLAAYLGFSNLGTYGDLVIWSSWCLICGIVAVIASKKE